VRWLVLTLAVLASAPAAAQTHALGAEDLGQGPFSIAEEGRISVVVPHAYALSEAAERLNHLLSYWKSRFRIAAEWHGNRVWLTGALFGLSVRAVFAVNEGEVVAVAADPGWPWRGKAEGYVEQKLKKYLHPTYADP
jgi:hypothetical protein